MHIPRSLPAALAALLALAPFALAQPETTSPSPPPPSLPAPAKDLTPPPPKKSEPAKPPLPPAPKPIAEITLKVGDKAPALKPKTWIKTINAAEISALESGKVYIIEFWATWCPSCRDAMPALAKLARAHKDLTIIAVASSERKPKKDAPDTRSDSVRAFVKEHDEAMPYAVLFDGARPTASAYLVPAGRVYLPTAFVIDATTTITFIGDPREKDFDTALAKALKAIAPPPPPKPTTPEPSKKPGKPKSK